MPDFHKLMGLAQSASKSDSECFVDFHGWSVPNLANVAVHVGNYPGRSQMALYVNVSGRDPVPGTNLSTNYVDVLAYFRNQHYARAAMMIFDKFAEAVNAKAT